MKSGIYLKNLDEFSPDMIQQDDNKSGSTFWGLFLPLVSSISALTSVCHLSTEDDLCPSITDRCKFILLKWTCPSLPFMAAAETEA